MTTYGIAADGTLTELDVMTFTVPSRASLRLP
jgi:hypothetical protein